MKGFENGVASAGAGEGIRMEQSWLPRESHRWVLRTDGR